MVLEEEELKPLVNAWRMSNPNITHTYEGVGGTKKWERLESYGPKFVENIVQAISHDILMYSIKMLSTYRIVAHVHDEVIIEANTQISVTVDFLTKK